MALETFPELATNLVYTVLCLVPGFVTLKTVQFYGDGPVDLDAVDKAVWSLVGSGFSLSALYFLYVAWVAVRTGRFVLVVPVDLQWTHLVAAYPLLLGIAAFVGYLLGRTVVRVRPVATGVSR